MGNRELRGLALATEGKVAWLMEKVHEAQAWEKQVRGAYWTLKQRWPGRNWTAGLSLGKDSWDCGARRGKNRMCTPTPPWEADVFLHCGRKTILSSRTVGRLSWFISCHLLSTYYIPTAPLHLIICINGIVLNLIFSTWGSPVQKKTFTSFAILKIKWNPLWKERKIKSWKS